MRFIFLLLMLMYIMPLHGQSLFDDAVSDSESDQSVANATGYELNGYVRGIFYGGEVPGESQVETKSRYGEASLKLFARKGGFGDAFTEMRFRKGYEFGSNVEKVDIREAYVKAYIGRFDVILGHQVAAWGRADGFNPTDNISPRDMVVRSPNEDDRRIGNFLLRSYYNLHDLRLEGIWIPTWKSSTLPFSNTNPASNIKVSSSPYGDSNLKSCGYALKLNLEKPSFGGSISYFNGLNTQPGLYLSFIANNILHLYPETYRMHVAGADFATTLFGDYGLRGEFAYRMPYGDYEDIPHVINPNLQYTVGMDRQIGLEGSVILQYIGRYVIDFKEAASPNSTDENEMGRYMIEIKNRMMASQQEEITHSVSFRPAWTLMYETLDVEMLGFYNITTEELFIRPKISYDLADDLSVTLGGEFYSGPSETLYGTIKEQMNAVFVELKASF